ncbi:MAG TPA: cupin domain-containing protein [Sulfuriferula sp.]|nr:cupin domain-containing protein [Sulfuriferula sp.]
MDKHLLGGISATRFLREYWQKKPLLVRNAVPGFAGLLSPDALIALSCADDVQARLISQKKRGWQLQHGPFTQAEFKRIGKLPWTLLVQELNHHLGAAETLLERFNFIPHARLDDLMVSYAVDGGGVGPHFDSYDVFLLQGMGQRLWQISAQDDLDLVPDVPLKILRHFAVEQEWLLNPGDMLYLPPHYAHNGVAVGECMTYSIGFRAPSVQEIATQFLVYLQDRIELTGMYQDPDLRLQKHPAQISDAMLEQVEAMLARIHWGRKEIADFLGCYLTEPKPHLFFDPPATPLSKAGFNRRARQSGVRLAAQSRMLFRDGSFFLNGEYISCGTNRSDLQGLADRRRLAPAEVNAELLPLLYELYLDGFLLLGAENIQGLPKHVK